MVIAVCYLLQISMGDLPSLSPPFSPSLIPLLLLAVDLTGIPKGSGQERS